MSRPSNGPLYAVIVVSWLVTALCWPLVYGPEAGAVVEAQVTLGPATAHSVAIERIPTSLVVEPVPRTRTRVVTTSAVAPATTPDLAIAGTGRVITVSATGYCSCVACCGPGGETTANGARTQWGVIAAPKGWSFGEQYTIDQLPGTVFTVQDRGGAISGNRIDIWFPSHSEALAWGRRTVTLRAVQ